MFYSDMFFYLLRVNDGITKHFRFREANVYCVFFIKYELLL